MSTTLWDISVEHFSRADEEWHQICSLASGRYLFDSLESAQAEAASIYGTLEWHAMDNGDYWCDVDDGRLVAGWVEGARRGGREMA